MNEGPSYPVDTSPPPFSVRLPFSRPVVTYVLLAAIALVFLLETIAGGSTRTAVLVALGAQINELVAQGQYWRLVSSMFLHIGVMHILFNGWALYVVGRDVEAFYGPLRFTLIYFLTGLFGSLATYLFADSVLSAGASGAVFGLIGAEIAYFLQNRELFREFSRRQLRTLAMLVAINLVFGFTVAGINNFAHLGGLISGLLIGLGLSPRYAVRWEGSLREGSLGEGSLGEGMLPRPQLHDRNPVVVQAAVVLLAVVLLAGGLQLGNQRWDRILGSGRPGAPTTIERSAPRPS